MSMIARKNIFNDCRHGRSKGTSAECTHQKGVQFVEYNTLDSTAIRSEQMKRIKTETETRISKVLSQGLSTDYQTVISSDKEN